MDGMVRHCLTNYEDGFQIYKWQILKICCFLNFEVIRRVNQNVD